MPLPTLTALRFAAAFWVLLFHFWDQVTLPAGPIAHGTRAVDFFFVLSGFILAHVYGKGMAEGRFRFRSFLWKRIARLYPIHLLTMAAVLGFLVVSRLSGLELNNAEKYDLSQLPTNLLLVQAWFPFTEPAFNIPAWSISAEMFVYLLFPLLMLPVLSMRPAVALAMAGAFLLLVVLAVRLTMDEDALRFMRLGAYRALPEFLLGLALWRCWASGLKVPPILLLPAIGAVLATAQWTLAGPPLFCVLILAAAERDRMGHRTPGWLVLLGEASFTLYMIHGPFQTALTNGMKLAGIAMTPVLFVLFVAAAVGLSVAVHLLFEAPVRRWLTREAPAPRAAASVPAE